MYYDPIIVSLPGFEREAKLCECGCGLPAPIAKRNIYADGWIKGQPKRFISGHNSKLLGSVKYLHSEKARKNSKERRIEMFRLGLLKMPSRKGCVSPRKGVPLPEEAKEKLRKANLGKHHGPEAKEKCRKAAIKSGFGGWNKGMKTPDEIRMKQSNALAGKIPKNNRTIGKFTNVKRGYYLVDGENRFFRSKWEANYALYLCFLKNNGEIKKWEYESECFIFQKIQFGIRSYRPDFKVTNNNNTVEYHEIKGWMTKESKTKLKRMDKYYPEIKIVLIDRKSYGEICKFGKMLNFY